MKNIVRSINRSHFRCGFFILAIALCCFALSPPLKAQGCPNPPGGCSGQNTAVGDGALANRTTGVWNVGVGFQALFNDTDGNQNTAIGLQALFSNVSGDHSTAIGSQGLFNNTTGNDNVGVGFRTLYSNTTGNRNTGMGYRTLANNTTADDNTAIGWNALFVNHTGTFNTAVGSRALISNVIDFNVAVGDSSLASFNGATGTDGANTALGSLALTALTSGQENVAVGRRAGEFLTDGERNVIVGWRAGDALTTGSGNTFLGSQAGSVAPNTGQYNNTILLGISGDSDANNPDGRAYIGNVRGVVVGNADGIPVIIDSTGQLGTANVSSRRFKEDIKPMDHKLSEAILKLKPVTFHYKGGDTKKAHDTPQFGLIAEDVAEVSPNLVLRNDKGEVSYVRYDAVNILLLNEFLNEHKKVEEQQASIADLKSTVALQQKGMEVLTAQLKEQAAQIQKVSAQLEASKPAPKVVANK